MTTIKGLKLQGSTYYVNVVVPIDVRHAFPTKSIWKTTGTGDPRDAAKIGDRLRSEIKKQIAEARRLAAAAPLGRDRILTARIALADWATSEAQRIVPTGIGIHPDWMTLARADALQKAVDDPEGYKAIAGFDQFLAEQLTAHGCPVGLDDPLVADMRREAALVFLYAVKFAERGRQANAFLQRARDVASQDLEEIAIVGEKAAVPLPPPALSISALFASWLSAIKPNAKQRQRYQHQLDRLIECVGDKPANYLDKADVTGFMSLVTRFPGRKRSSDLAALPMPKVVERFEAINAKRVALSQPLLPSLTITTVGDWFDCFSRCWDYGVAFEHVERNPWQGLRKFVVAGRDPVARRAFTDDEIKLIFSKPLFTGHADNDDGYRNRPGTAVIKDAKYWLPLLSLLHGQRLTEFAAMPLADVMKTPKGTWYFDLTKRKLGHESEGAAGVKNETSQRYIPLHPDIIRLDFTTYIENLQGRDEAWLFPELNHKSRFGPGHEISKWWGRWMDKVGLSDPTITHHSFRHSWKRRARATAEVKEEMHDVLSGHKGLNTVARRYGEGAPIEELARDMAKIKFPALMDPLSPKKASAAP